MNLSVKGFKDNGPKNAFVYSPLALVLINLNKFRTIKNLKNKNILHPWMMFL
jgi:hypothetical protein